MSEDRVLVLCVDKDDDIGRVGIKTPLIGYDSVLKAAIDFAVKRPEDADTNAIFSALKLARELSSEGKKCEVALIAGDPVDDVKAGNRIRDQLKRLLQVYDATGVIVVSDGADDELVLPVIQSLVPIVGIKRVVVEQLRGVEETYVLIGRYLKKIFEEPRFARIFLGVPGILLIILGILSQLNLLELAATATLLILGATMVVRGFSIDRKIEEWWESSPIIFASATLSSISLIVAVVVAISSISSAETPWSTIGRSLLVASPFLTFSGLAFLVGKSIVKVMRRDIKIWHEVIGIMFMAFFYRILLSISNVLQRLPLQPTGEELVSIVNSSELYFWLFTSIGVLGGLALVFTFIERQILQEEKRSIREMERRLKRKRYKLSRR